MQEEGKSDSWTNSENVQDLVSIFFLAFITTVLYSQTLHSPIIFDDWHHLTANPHIQITSLNWQSLKKAAFESPLKTRPVANASFALNYYFHKFELPGYHITNITVHILSGIILYFVFKVTLALSSLHEQARSSAWLPFAAALVWIVHPLHIQSVTYIIQRMNSMAAMFYVLALLLYIRARLAKSFNVQTILFFLAFVSGILAIGTKEIAATLPLFIFLYEWFFFQNMKTVWLKKKMLPGVLVCTVFCIIAVMYLDMQPLESIRASYAIREFSMYERVLTEFRVVAFYISQLFFPHPGRLNLDHHFVLSASLFSPLTTLASMFALLGLFLGAVWMAKKQRLLSYCILWFLGNLVIESSVYGLEVVFEHRTYLPSMMAVLALVVVVDKFIQFTWLKLVSAVVVVVLLSSWTYQRNKVWLDEVSLRRDAVAKSPSKPRVHAILANALERQGQFAEAASSYQAALRLNPGNADEIHYNLGNVMLRLGKVDTAAQHFQAAKDLNPRRSVYFLNLAYALDMQGREQEAVNMLQELLRNFPEDVRGHNNYGLILMRQGEVDRAIGHFRAALKVKPGFHPARMNLNRALQMKYFSAPYMESDSQ